LIGRLRASTPAENRRLPVLLVGLLLGLVACHRQAKNPAAEPVDQVYKQALEKIAKKHYYSARSLLQSLQTRIPQDDRELLPLVQLKLADAFYLDGGILNLGEALNAYRNFLTYFSQRDEAAYAQFQVGQCYLGQVLAPDRDQALTYKAIDEYSKLERLYPNSSYVGVAREQILVCHEKLAAHEFVIGYFYYRRKAYLAAADRFRVVLDKFPQYSGTEETLLLLGNSLLATANPDEARLYFERLVHEFPDGRFTREARNRLKEQGKG
jgi:outer membrane protein assembly factor BamD